MKLIHRYIFKQVLVASLLSVALFMFVLIVGNALRDIVGLLAGGKLPWSTFFKLLLTLIPYVFSYALPLGLVTGILVIFGRMSSQNEITAIKSSGSGLWDFSKPVFLIAVLGTLFAFWINAYYAPAAKTSYKSGIKRTVRDNPLQFIQPNTFIKSFPGYILYLGKKKSDQVSDFWIWELDDHGRVQLFVKAKEGLFTYDEDKNALLLTLYNGSGEHKPKQAPENPYGSSLLTVFFKELIITLSLDPIFGSQNISRKLSMMSLTELLELQESVDEEADFAYWVDVRLHIQKNLAMAFSVIALAVIAIPLALKTSRSETSFNVALALGLALSYYFFVIVITWFSSCPQYRPDWLVWLPNFIYLSLGAVLFKRACRY